jgi:serine/threonine-protein kinase
MLFEMLTGTLPFTSHNPNGRQAVEEIRNKIKYEPTPQMRNYYPFIGQELQYIVDRALAKAPSQRYQSCEEFKRFIVDYMHKKRY